MSGRGIAENRLEYAPPGSQIAIIVGLRLDRYGSDFLLESKLTQDDHSVAGDLNAGSDLTHLSRLLYDNRLDTLLTKGNSGRQPANATTNDEHAHGHLSVIKLFHLT
jgi:hypothetical protein